MIEAIFPKIEFDKSGLYKAMLHFTNTVRTAMLDRAKSGQDVNHKDFEPYAKGTLKYNKIPLGKGARVTLQDKSRMLKSMTLRKASDGYEIFLNAADRANVAWYHNEGTNKMPKREWIGVNEADADKYMNESLSKYEMVK